MAKSRRKSGGCKNGSFKRKKMGKGWSTHRVVRATPKPIDRSGSADAASKAS